ncbi:hypothetical protein EW093_01235 [Thiospirochaeta perfilievii]|uniref:HepT-like domain-containing protein n=1 Tax=Thiospirochaeta perfilievii TaxID=252967 RepID=A0A5C1Q7H3_9SPIO|nr:hypothetical protein [Thiospirochaeta perfilievii]QEN03381.1 hypothetical protein EW093_01235 [Thiospirochaeta perfilievii]
MKLHKLIDAEFASINKELDVLELLNKKLQTNLSLDEIEVRAAAMTLVSIYNGIEKVLERIVKDRNLKLDGSNWHTNLLNTSLENNIIPEAVFNDLKGFLAFRHFVRHAYSFQIKIEAITSIIKKVPTMTIKLINNLKY